MDLATRTQTDHNNRGRQTRDTSLMAAKGYSSWDLIRHTQRTSSNRKGKCCQRSSYLPLPHAEDGRVEDQHIAAFAQVMKGNCDRDKQRQSFRQSLSSNSTSPNA